MAASIGKVALALASGTNENNVAFAHVNFDFSIVKFAAPAEFQGLGISLSSKRRQEAEDGPIHTVARKLVALFAETVPNTPNLNKAFGTRASEIAENSAANPKGTPQDGAFQDLVGVDGTSVWAAATSGQGAIALHLLACMLARIWKGPQAISIWAELVNARRQRLQKRLDGDTFMMADVTAAKIQLNRDQLAEWDASARAWLDSADIANKTRQTQLMLILNNLGLSIASDSSVYESVINAWKAALEFMERIIQGIPQTVQSPAVLLALSSWHLYPDMTVLGGRVKNVKQNDPLINPGGIVTIGLSKSTLDNDFGISWSLPLSHLRYYGNPMQATGSISLRTSRISMEDLVMVCFGCVTRDWVNRRANNTHCARFFIALRNAMPKTSGPPPWLELLGNVASSYVAYTGEAKEKADRLIGFGRRRSRSFLSASTSALPLAFDLQRPEVFIELLRGTEAKIKWIRQKLERINGHDVPRLNLTEALIRYKPDHTEYTSPIPLAIFDSDDYHKHPMHPDRWVPDYPFNTVYEWASLFPVFMDEHGHVSHRRWLPGSLHLDHSDHTERDTLARRRYTNMLDPTYCQVNTCAVKRSIELETNTGEPCSILLDEPVRENSKNPFINEAIWKSSSSARPPLRPIQGRFLDASPIATERSSIHLRDQNYHPAAAFSNNIECNPRSVRFKLNAMTDGCSPCVESKMSGGRQWTGTPRSSRGLGAIFSSFFSRDSRETLLTEEIMRISEICKQELKEIDSGSGRTRYESVTNATAESGNETRLSTEAGPSTDTGPSSEIQSSRKLQTGSEAEKSISECSGDNINVTASSPTWDCKKSGKHCLQRWYLKVENRTVIVRYSEIFRGASIQLYVRESKLPALLRAFGSDGRGVSMLDEMIPALEFEDVIEVLESNQMEGSALVEYLFGGKSKFWTAGHHNALKSLEALHFASVVYSTLPGATVDLSITGKPLHEFQWADHDLDHLAHARSLSCVATFESGHLNIAPGNLEAVLGISTGNSLYITQYLCSDPYSPTQRSVIRRSIGNVGKPGMAFLISPTNPKMKDPGYENWTNVPHLEFDGKFEENFERTSAHLSFTGYEQAFDTGEHGLLDKPVYFLESVVEVYDSGSWVADLDILTALNGEVGRIHTHRLPNERVCSHPGEAARDYLSLAPITSIDTWIELLDPPNNACIVRAGRNWLARLTAVVIGIQQSRPVIIASRSVCWACVKNLSQVSDFSKTIIVC